MIRREVSEMFKSKSQKNFSNIVFVIYFVLLIWLVLFKFNINLREMSFFRSVNIIPFYYDREIGFAFHFKEVLYNVLIFIPLGFCIDIYKSDWSFFKKILPCLSISLLFEIMQFVFALGASDITDIITNTAGGIVGIILCLLFKKMFPQKHITIINILGFIAEILAILLLAILLIANS